MNATCNRIYLRGNFAEGNFGDDALLVANVLLARRQGFDLSVIGGPPAYIDERFAAGCLTETDVRAPGLIQYGGGTQFFSLPWAMRDAQYAAKGYNICLMLALRRPSRLVRSAKARLACRRISALPHLAIGLGIGPFMPEDAADEANVAALLRRMAFLWVRDPASAEFCREHGAGSATLSADLCFTEPFQTLLGGVNWTTSAPAPNRIGVVLRDHPSLDGAFHKKMSDFARHFRSTGYGVDFISFSEGDRFIAEYREAGETVVQWNPRVCKIEEFSRKLGEYTILLTARFHGGIFGVINRTPFTVIGVDEKLHSLGTRYHGAKIAVLAPGDPIGRYLTAIEEQTKHIAETKEALAAYLLEECALARAGEDAYARFLAAASGNPLNSAAPLSSKST